MRLSEMILAQAANAEIPAWANFQAPEQPDKIEFCVYTPDQPDYWGEFRTRKELFAFMDEHFPGYTYDSKNSNQLQARYTCGGVLIIVRGI